MRWSGPPSRTVRFRIDVDDIEGSKRLVPVDGIDRDHAHIRPGSTGAPAIACNGTAHGHLSRVIALRQLTATIL
ncbi:MAG TPA: hypothetical protein VHU42_16025 [Rhodopila sp.]|nr:hypothetical protein [Rhodopila sp.]